MSNLALRIENLGKKYSIGRVRPGTETFVEALSNMFYAPFRKSGPKEIIWALQNVSFEVKKGEVVGIVGRNGAGKSTLLKILSRITEPTEGIAHISGRVGSLLEVGTGFHPELTGRENIFLNGAILGMRRAEIIRKFDEIVAFAEVEKFIDTPVKFYSSGMYVRLAFAVAAHLEPQILLVDEVLAVGDAAFQKKCLGKMGEAAKDGRTVLFVSHNMSAVKNLCTRSVLLEGGKLALDADTDTVISRYLNQNLTEGAVVEENEIAQKVEGYVKKTEPSIRFKKIRISGKDGKARNSFYSDEPIRVEVSYQCLTKVKDLRIIVQIVDESNTPLLTSMNLDDADEFKNYKQDAGIYSSECIVPPDTFGEKRFYISVQLLYLKTEHLLLNKILMFDVKFKGYNNIQDGSNKESFLRPQLKWKTEAFCA